MLGCIYTIDGGRISLVLPLGVRTRRMRFRRRAASMASCGVWGARIPLDFEEK